jgi:hypothetical protein
MENKMRRFTASLGTIVIFFSLWGISWAQVNRILPPPEGGTINALATDPFNSLVVYVGTAVGGVFKSTDRGDTWSPADNGLGSSMISSLAPDPLTLNILYAGTKREGIFKSTDGG